ncbi:hypothetical protein M3Y94_00650800 [Aphelenchoides besseyi]|nr:hypothetical protein M3Y94_00650800 [Aphelenchoides besseyi]KAI6231120.1 BTB domain-containing protein [Aphelenchoides besseyi]
MSVEFGTTTKICWNIRNSYVHINDFSTHRQRLKEPVNVAVQVNYTRGNWILMVTNIEPATKIRLQLKASLKIGDKSVFLHENWSETQTFDTENPSFQFSSGISYDKYNKTESVDLHVEIRPVYQKAPTFNPEWKLVPAITTTFNDQDSADAEIKVGDSTFKVHKFVLTLQSDVFKSMFEREWKEKQSNVVDIKEADEEVVEAMLHYMYSGQVKNIDKVADRLLLLSDQYHLEGLTGMCMKALGENLTMENIIERLQLFAYPKHLTVFKKPAFKFVVENFAAISELPEWQTFVLEHGDIVNEILSFSCKSY